MYLQGLKNLSHLIASQCQYLGCGNIFTGPVHAGDTQLFGTIDCIATDHAPHTEAEKAVFETAPNGIVGLETSLALCLTYLVRPGIISIARLIKMIQRKIMRSRFTGDRNITGFGFPNQG